MICSVGLANVDIMSYVKKYPLEDSDQRCTRQSWERGGNASNNATVISSLGAKCEFFGTLSRDHMLQFLLSDMDSCGIKHDNCPIYDDCQTPISVVINSEETGSRTIVHHRGTLPELTFDDFNSRLDLNMYTWVHFEGRNEKVGVEMIKRINEFNTQNTKIVELTDNVSDPVPNYRKKRIPISVEVEKVRDILSIFIPEADLIFIGKDFAQMKGAKNCTEAVEIISKEAQPGTVVICAWGEQGAAFTTVGVEPFQVKTVSAFPPDKIIDSLGAGDTFFGTIIYCLSSGLDIEASIRLASRLASAKLSHYGFKNLGTLAKEMPEYQQIQKIAASSKSDANILC